MTTNVYLCFGKDPERFDRKRGSKIGVERQALVKIYNTFMDGLDKTDMVLSLYRRKFKFRFTYSAWQYATSG